MTKRGERPMRRPLFLTVAVVAGLLVAAILALIAFRATLAEALLTSRLAALGVPAPRLAVESLKLDRAVITDITLGAEGELRADAVTITYRPGALLSGQLDEVAIDGLRLRLDLSGAGPPLGSLQHLLGGGNGAAGPAAMPALVRLAGSSRIEAVTGSGDVAAAVSGYWQPVAGTAALTVNDVILPHVALAESRFDVALTPDRIDATATARGAGDAVSLELSATVGSWRGEPTLALDLDGDLAPAAWRTSPLPLVEHGTLGVSLHLAGRLQPIKGLIADPAALDWLLRAELGGLLDATLTDIAWRDRVQGVSGKLGFAVTVADSALAVESTGDGRVRIARVDPAWLDATGIAALAPQLRDSELSLSLAPQDRPLRVQMRRTTPGANFGVSGNADVALGEAELAVRAEGSFLVDDALSLRRVSLPRVDLVARDLTVAGHRIAELHLAGEAAGAPGNLKGSARLTAALAATRIETLSLGGATLDLAADFGWSDDRLDIRQRGDGAASLASADLAAAVRIARPLGIALTEGTLTFDTTPAGTAVSHAITLRPDPAEIALARAKGPPVVLRADTGPMRLEGAIGRGEPYRGKLSLASGKFGLPDEAISADAVSASVSLAPAPGQPLAAFTVGRLKHTASPAYFGPLRLEGQISRHDDALVLTAAGSGGARGPKISVRGRHRMADGSGSMRIELAQAALRKGALQPAQISPLFNASRDATGRIGAVADVTWGPGGVKGKGAMDLIDISFSTDTTAVEGLDTSITLDGLFPVSTPRDQRLAMRRIDPALPVEDIAARFRVERGDPPRLRVREAVGRFAGGRLHVANVTVDPSQPSHAFAIAVDGVDLGILLGLVNVEGVSGTGRLSGTIPVTITDGNVIVEDGRLAAQGPGVLRVRSEAATSALGGAGEQVALMLQALEDFRYESLTATLDIEADGAATAVIHMQGSNPAVLDGYPFAFNIELGGNAADLLVALRQGAQISTDLIRPGIH